MILQCKHIPKQYRMFFGCKRTGDYTIELCEQCHQGESNDFLIKEEKIQ